MRKIEMSMRRAMLSVILLVVALVAIWLVDFGLEIRGITRSVGQPELLETEAMQRRLNGLDKLEMFWETDWDEAMYEEHLDSEHAKTGLFAGTRTFLAKLHEAFWLYIFKLGEFGRNPLIVHRLIKDYWLMIGGVALLIWWIGRILRIDQWSDYSHLFRSGWSAAFWLCLQLLAAAAMAVMVLWRQSFEPGSLAIMLFLALIIAMIGQLTQGEVGQAAAKRRERQAKRQARRSSNGVAPLPQNVLQVIKRALGLQYW